jgi:uncharacterized protein
MPRAWITSATPSLRCFSRVELDPGIQRGEDPQPLAAQVLFAVLGAQLPAHEIQKGREMPFAARHPRRDPERLRPRGFDPVGRGQPLPQHAVEHQVAAGQRTLGEPARVVVTRAAREPDQQRQLIEFEFVQPALEVELGGEAEAVNRAVPGLPQEDLVQVGLQDLLLGVAVLQQDGHHRLVELALQALLVGQVEVLHQLLGQGAAALHGAPGTQVGPGRAQDADRIHAPVGEEAPVLGGEQRRDEPRRHVGQRHQDAVLPVRGVDAADQHRLDPHQVHAAALVPEVGDHAAGHPYPYRARGLGPVAEDEGPGVQGHLVALERELPGPGIALLVVQGLEFQPQQLRGQRAAHVQLQRTREHPCRQGPALALETGLDLAVQLLHVPRADPARDQQQPEGKPEPGSQGPADPRPGTGAGGASWRHGVRFQGKCNGNLSRRPLSGEPAQPPRVPAQPEVPMDPLEQQQQLLTTLSDPARFPHPAAAVERIETHISTVLLAGEHAYKFKKPVNLGFLDFSTLEARQRYCGAELDINRTLAPGIYLDVVEVRGPAEDPHFGGDGPVLEYAVHMRRFDRERQLDRLLEAGRLPVTAMDELGVTVARFHESAERARPDSEHGTPAQVLAPMLANFEALAPSAEAMPGRRQRLGELESWTRDTAQRLAALIDERRAGGFVRACHGDMHLGNMVYVDDGAGGDRLAIFDGIEFNPSLRWIDVASEIAFLTMDLHARGAPGHAHRVLNVYLEHRDDSTAIRLLPFYQVYRALVRAKVNAIHAAEPGLAEEARRQCDAEVERYLALAGRLRDPGRPGLILMHGCRAAARPSSARRYCSGWAPFACAATSNATHDRAEPASPAEPGAGG